jgi:hypothetical protein
LPDQSGGDFRRVNVLALWTAKPRPTKPRSIIAQVDGSGITGGGGRVADSPVIVVLVNEALIVAPGPPVWLADNIKKADTAEKPGPVIVPS